MIISDSVRLEPLSLSDARELFNVVQQEREYLTRYLYWVEEVEDIKSMEKYIQQRVGFPDDVARWYKILISGRIVGVFGVRTINKVHYSIEVAYWLAREAQGRNITCQCIEKIKVELKQEYDIKTVEIHCLRKNTTSQCIAKKCGGLLKSITPRYSIIDGIEQDLLVYHLPT